MYSPDDIEAYSNVFQSDNRHKTQLLNVVNFTFFKINQMIPSNESVTNHNFSFLFPNQIKNKTNYNILKISVLSTTIISSFGLISSLKLNN